MRIVSLNAWGGTLHAPLMAWLPGAGADILCLQEVIDTPDSPADWLTYRDGAHVLPQRARLFAEICTALPGHVGFFCPAARGVLWDETRSVPSYWGLATFVRRDLVVIGQAQGFVHGDFSADGYGDHPRPRNAHVVRVHDGERIVTVAQMHGLRDLAGKQDTPERRLQAGRFLRLAQGVAGPGDLTVLCGDFNVEPESETLALMQAQGFAELVTAGGHDGTRTSHYPKPGRFADYMLVNRPESIRHFDVLRAPEVSDHCPLILTL